VRFWAGVAIGTVVGVVAVARATRPRPLTVSPDHPVFAPYRPTLRLVALGQKAGQN